MRRASEVPRQMIASHLSNRKSAILSANLVKARNLHHTARFIIFYSERKLRMIRQLLVGAAFMGIVGCEASTKIAPPMGSNRSSVTEQQQETAQLAAYAATAK